MPTVIDLIRHGTPEGGNKYRGHNIDDPLSEKGWQQMWSAVENCPPWDQLVTSPMRRCQAFAESYAEKHGLPVNTDERLKEIGFGEWEGHSGQEVLAKDPDAIKNFYHDPVKHQPRGAEPVASFQNRVNDALRDILKVYHDKNILLVAHAGVMRAAITGIMQVDAAAMYRISIGNAAIIRIKDDHIRPPTVILE